MRLLSWIPDVVAISYVHDTSCSEAGKVIARLRSLVAETRLGEAKLAEALRRLDEAVVEARVANWDGYGSLPADEEAVQRATGVLKALPSDADVPNVGVDPDGEIAIEWMKGRSVLSVSIGCDGTFTYAGIFGNDSVRGEERTGGEIPGAILVGLRRLFVAHDRIPMGRQVAGQ